jgi:acyl carrier protein
MSANMSVEETIKKIALKILRKTEITFGTNTTFRDLGADSLDIVQIMVNVEDTYDIELDDDELLNIKDTAGFVAYVERKIADKNK